MRNRVLGSTGRTKQKKEDNKHNSKFTLVMGGFQTCKMYENSKQSFFKEACPAIHLQLSNLQLYQSCEIQEEAIVSH